jgi:hypothetical protein
MSMDRESAEEPVRSHTRRLNVQFEDERAPALDDVTRIEEMRRAATNYDFKVPDLSHNQDSIIPPVSDGILEIPLRIRASLFFFEPTSIHDIIVIKGCICCRLGPGMEPFNNLLSLTDGFQVKESFMPCSQRAREAFRVCIDFREEIYQQDEQVRIDVRGRTGTDRNLNGHLWRLNGHSWHLNGQPQEPKIGAFWGLKLLPMVPNVTFSGYGFVPLLSGARTATPMWQELSGVGILQRLGQNGLPRG